MLWSNTYNFFCFQITLAFHMEDDYSNLLLELNNGVLICCDICNCDEVRVPFSTHCVQYRKNAKLLCVQQLFFNTWEKMFCLLLYMFAQLRNIYLGWYSKQPLISSNAIILYPQITKSINLHWHAIYMQESINFYKMKRGMCCLISTEGS